MFKTLIKEFKRYNDIKEKELDLKILSSFDYERKWGVYPTQPLTTPHQVVVYSADNNNNNSWVAGRCG